MNVSTHESHHSLELLKWLVLVALASLFVIALATHTAGIAAAPETPEKVFIVSHWNGIFRASEHPGARLFVELGSQVEPGTTVGVIEEVMVDTPPRSVAVPAGVAGTITAVLVEDGEMVLVGQTLFELHPDDSIVAE
jgi:biotin carboxyl carrier protein